MTSNAIIGDENMVIPRFIALKTIGEDTPKYLCTLSSSAHDAMGYLKFATTRVLDPLAKIELVPVRIGGNLYYHIRSCSLNRFWRESPTVQSWIVAAGKEAVTDEKSGDCTLFTLNVEGNTVTISPVRSGKSICLMPTVGEDKALSTGRGCTEVVKATMIDVGSIMVLPRYVSFKGKNGKYLKISKKDVIVDCLPGAYNAWNSSPYGYMPYSPWNGNSSTYECHTNLQFAAEDMSSKEAVFEVINTDDGLVRIKSTASGKFLHVREVTQWVEADIVDGENGYNPHPLRYMFEVIPADKDNANMVSLKSKSMGKFCTIKDGDFRRSDCLWAGADTPEEKAKLELVEPINQRTVHVVEFRLNEIVLISEEPIVAATCNFFNTSSIEQETKLEKTIKDTKTNTWNNGISTTKGFSFNLTSGIPDKVELGFTVSSETTKEYQWGKSIETSYETSGGGPIKVPAWKRVTGKLLASKATFEVPFTYTQTDRLSTGEIKTYQLQDGVFTGVIGYTFTTELVFENIHRL